MHILTKIFIVLTALLTVALVPLVMINTANDETFKKRWLDAQADGKKAIFEKDAAQRLQARGKQASEGPGAGEGSGETGAQENRPGEQQN